MQLILKPLYLEDFINHMVAGCSFPYVSDFQISSGWIMVSTELLSWFVLQTERWIKWSSEEMSRNFQELKGDYGKDGDNLFSKTCCDRTRGNGFKLKEGRFRLDIRKKVLQ